MHPFHEPHLRALEEADDTLRIHPLLTYRRLRKSRRIDVEQLLEDARSELDRADVEPDAICTYWDFPSSCLAPILSEERGLPTPGLDAVLRCEHKYWSRRVQQAAVPSATPDFQAVDVHADDAEGGIQLDPPFWLKPVKSYSSHLSFRVDDDDDLREALEELDRRIDRIGQPFQRIVERTHDLPAPVRAVPGNHALAEAPLSGWQCTVEGHVMDGEVHVHGIFDIHRTQNGSTFSHYDYPSTLPEEVQDAMEKSSGAFLNEAGFDVGAWNIEFFHDPEARSYGILEVNPRISQEHTDLTAWVDGTSNLEVMVRAALGRPPRLTPGAREHAVARKHFVRTTEDGVVARVPTDEELADIEDRFAPCRVSIEVDQGDRLSELEEQESYSYTLAYVYLAGEHREALDAQVDRVVAALPLEIDR